MIRTKPSIAEQSTLRASPSMLHQFRPGTITMLDTGKFYINHM